MKKIPVYFEASCVDNGTLWVSSSDYNGLLRMDIKSGHVHYCGEFPDEDSLKQRLHYGNALKVDNKIYFIPLESCHMHIYDISKDVFESYYISEQAAGYSFGTKWENYIYMVSTRKNNIARFNLKTKKFEIVYENSKIILGYQHGIYVYNEKMYLMPYDSNSLLQFNIKENTVQEWNIEGEGNTFQILGGKGSDIYIINKKSKYIFIWNINLQEMIATGVYFKQEVNSWQNGKWIVGNNWNDNKVFIFEINEKKVSSVCIKDYNSKTNQLLINSAFVYGDDILFATNKGGDLYSVKDGSFKKSVFIDENDKKKKIIDCQRGKCELTKKILEEKETIDLETYIHLVTNTKSDK